jgi:hypothetical protein
MDHLRQVLNLVLAIGMPVVTGLAFGTGTTFDEATRSDVGEPRIVPAGYAFVIWTLIYGGSVGYGVYQFAAARRDDPLLRDLGWFTASAFLGTCAWLVFARFNLTWMTVACIVWMLVSLAGAFRGLLAVGRPLTAAEHWLVLMPVSVFLGWVTVATFANTAAALKRSGWLDVGMPEQNWTVLMLLAAGAVASAVVVASRGNAWYAGTIAWALVAIAVANVYRDPNRTVAGVAGAAAAGVILILFYVRLFAGHSGAHTSG